MVVGIGWVRIGGGAGGGGSIIGGGSGVGGGRNGVSIMELKQKDYVAFK